MTQLFNAVFTSEIMWEIYAKKFTRGREILRVYWKLFSRDGVKLSSEENILNFMLISTKCENSLELLRDTQRGEVEYLIGEGGKLKIYLR